MALGTVDASAVVDLFTQNWQMIILTHYTHQNLPRVINFIAGTADRMDSFVARPMGPRYRVYTNVTVESISGARGRLGPIIKVAPKNHFGNKIREEPSHRMKRREKY
eukprot:scaffold116818_cov25-Attheya_sp.AAC.1